jgi:hypothetical protein
MDINKVPGYDVQMLHLCCGGAICLVLGLWLPIFVAGGITLALAVAKESIEAKWGLWEERDTWAGSAVDVAFFAVGIQLAELILSIKRGF